MVPGSPGRRPVPEATVDLVRRLLAAGLTEREAVACCAALDRPLGKTTVHRIAAGEHLNLLPGEVRLAQPQKCDEGHWVTVKPCRTCASMLRGY
jgi:hypothetical protein